jgi:cation diffusion facilitator CzcD-associated flavoprotein CzcO
MIEIANMDAFDLVIIGAGIHGIAVLKTYRDVNPTASILVLDKGSSLGGVWAKDNLYPGLHTNNHFKTFEVFTDRIEQCNNDADVHGSTATIP